MTLSFLHTSDVHLGMKFKNKQFSLKEREKRRQELWDTFEHIINMSNNEKISYLFIAGDMTQEEYCNFKDMKRIAHKFSTMDFTKVIIACGSNDPYNMKSIYEYVDWSDNVHIIKNTDTMQKMDFKEDNLCVYSMSWDKKYENLRSQAVYNISTDENKINVLLLNCSSDKNSKSLFVDINTIKNRFDYCALGYEHNYREIAKNAVYCGAPEPLGFDEVNAHGVIRGNLEKQNVSYEFYPIAKRSFITREIVLEADFSFNKILDLIKFSGNTFSNIKDYVLVKLTGIVNTDISMEEIKSEASQFFYYIEFEENYMYKNDMEKSFSGSEDTIIESYKMQFEDLNSMGKIEKRAFELGLEVLRKEKVVG